MKAISGETIRQKCSEEPWCRETRGFVKFGGVPQWLEDIAHMMPAGSPEQKDYLEGAEFARSLYREEALQSVDPAKVKEICQTEPWTEAASLETIGVAKFGYVTEKLEKAMELFPEGSPERAAYAEAFEAAKDIYFESIHNYARRFARGKTRAEVEEMNSRLWGKAHLYEGDGTYRRSRMIKLCELVSDYQRSLNPAPAPDSTRAHYILTGKTPLSGANGPG